MPGKKYDRPVVNALLNPALKQASGPENRLMIQASSFSITGEIADRLLRDYNDHLITDLGMMRRRDVKAKDIIDLRSILALKNIPDWQMPDPKLDIQDRLYMAQDYYYCYIPCFEEGVYHLNTGRYLYWKIKDLDLVRHRMMIWLQDFVYYADGSGWQPGVYGTVAWRFEDPEDALHGAYEEHRRVKCQYAATEDSVTDYVQMYRLLDVKTLGWSEADIKNWDQIVIAHAREGCSVMKQRTGRHNLDNLAAMFTSYTAKTNRILSEYKAAQKSTPVSKQEHEDYLKERSEAKARGEKPAKPERRIRVIGPISVTSRQKPKAGRAAANYTKASWTTRSHFRTIKSGGKTRKIFVKASVHRRKALITPENITAEPETTPVTIRLEKPKPKTKGGSESEP